MQGLAHLTLLASLADVPQLEHPNAPGSTISDRLSTLFAWQGPDGDEQLPASFVGGAARALAARAAPGEPLLVCGPLGARFERANRSGGTLVLLGHSVQRAEHRDSRLSAQGQVQLQGGSAHVTLCGNVAEPARRHGERWRMLIAVHDPARRRVFVPLEWHEPLPVGWGVSAGGRLGTQGGVRVVAEWLVAGGSLGEAAAEVDRARKHLAQQVGA